MFQGLLVGLTAGGAYALLAVCLTVMYQLARTLNFAQMGIAVIGVYLTVTLAGDGMSLGLAVLAGLAASAVAAALAGLAISTWFAEAGADQRSAITIAFLLASVSLSLILYGDRPRRFPALISGEAVTVGGVTLTWVTVVCVLGAITLAAAARALLTRTALGLRLQALAERPTTAELLGIRVRPLVVGVWVGVSLVTTMTLLVISPTRTNDQLSLGLLIVPAAAAALVGALRSLAGAVVGGLLLGALQGLLANVTAFQQYRDTIPFLAIVAILLWSQRREVWDVAR